MGGLYFEDRKDQAAWVFCQLTGKACYCIGEIKENPGSQPDCRKCNIPIAFAIMKATGIRDRSE